MTDPTTTARQQKQRIREALDGYAVMNEIIEAERIERLRRMTVEESLADYVAIVGFQSTQKKDSHDEGLRRLEDWRLEEKLAMRRVFEAVARAQGYL
jgi:hypothetical protein